MQERRSHTRTDSAEFEALNTLVEAYLMALGPKDAGRYLRALAAILAEAHASNVISLRDATADARRPAAAQDWLRERLSIWLARHG